MSAQPSKEQRILKVMRQVLTRIARETHTQPGLKHPLSQETIGEMRQCLELISAREHELTEADTDMRPRFIDEPTTRHVVSLDSLTKKLKPH